MAVNCIATKKHRFSPIRLEDRLGLITNTSKKHKFRSNLSSIARLNNAISISISYSELIGDYLALDA